MMTLTILNHKDLYSPALPVVNILCDIQAVNYIAIVGIAKRNVIVGTDEPAMLVRKQLKQKAKNKKGLVAMPSVGAVTRSLCL